ncbi:MAG: protein-glutamine gamma-glutamyltransferase [Betaproteobacteria bacterium]
MTQTLALRHTFWLTAALGLVAMPHAQRLPWWLNLLLVTLFTWRLYLAHMRLPLPHRGLVLFVVIAATAGVYLHFETLFGRDAGVALLVIMLTLKLLEMRTARDAMLLIFLAYFLVITNFLYSQTIATAVYMLACVWIITAGMVGIHYRRAPHAIAPLRAAGVLLVQSVPLMLLLFVLFPRVQGPLWRMPLDAQRSSTGLSDTMSPGSLSDLTLSDAVAFRAAFKSSPPLTRNLYWRGPVLWHFDGRTWRAPRPDYSEPVYQTHFDPVEYTVTVEPHGKTWLFALDLPAYRPPGSITTSDFQLISTRPVTTRTRYDMTSFLDYSYGADESEATLRRAVQLPPSFNPRTVQLGRELKNKYGSERAVINAVLSMFGRDGYAYTLSPPLLGEHSVDEFMFVTKSGFCEHYASAFAVIMRAAGVPARVVTGYMGGEMNPIGNYLIVRQADAHAWTEVWLRGEGWIRVDPTAAVSPARVERGISAAMSERSVLPLFAQGDFPLLRELRYSWDSLANTWNQWVLGYTPERQRALLTRAGLDDTTWRALAMLLLAGTSAIATLLVLLTLRRLRVRVRDPVRLAYLAFCNKLTSRGLARQDAEGPLSYGERVSRARPDLESVVSRFIRLYVELRYGRESGMQHVIRLQRLARDFKP